MSIGVKYQENLQILNNLWDVIIIGSGISGLTTAILLAKKGKKVLVLEGHYKAGGFTHTYKKNGFEFDSGVHYVGDVHNLNHPTGKIFHYISDGQIKWNKMSSAYDKVIFDNTNEKYDFVEGIDNNIDNLLRYFPKEKSSICRYYKEILSVESQIPYYSIEKALKRKSGSIASRFLSKKFINHAKLSTKEVLDSITNNEKLKSVLAGQWGTYGLPPEYSSFANHAIVVSHFMDGGSYPVGGSEEIAKSIYDNLKKNNGEIVTKAKVVSINQKNKVIKGVTLENGHEIYAPVVVSSAGVIQTFNKLLNNDAKNEMGLMKIKSVRPGLSFVSLNIGAKSDFEFLKKENGNLWVFESSDHLSNYNKIIKNEIGDIFPVSFITFPSNKDPDYIIRNKNKMNINISAFANYSITEKWDGTTPMKRGVGYNEFKQEIQVKLLNTVLKYCPDLRGNIEYLDTSTPLTSKHFMNSSLGEMYGIQGTSAKYMEKWLRPDTPIKGLYLTGQDILSNGILGAMFSGVMTSINIMGITKSFDILKMILPHKFKHKSNLV